MRMALLNSYKAYQFSDPSSSNGGDFYNPVLCWDLFLLLLNRFGVLSVCYNLEAMEHEG